MRAELDRVGSDGEIPFTMDAGVGLVDDVKLNALRRGKRQRRRIELRVKPSHGEDEVRVVAVGEQNADLAVDGNEQKMRVEQRGKEIQPLLVELERAGKIDLQLENWEILGGQSQLEDAQKCDVAGRYLHDDTERQADQGGFAPTQFGHRPDQKCPFLS